MRNITFAIYKGKEYPAGMKRDGQIVLRSQNPDDINHGFEKKVIGQNKIYVKYVTKNKLEQLYDKRITAIYKGYEFEVIEENGDNISIVTMAGDYRDWLNLGMKCIDKGVYQKWINKDEADIKVVKEEL